VTQPLLKVPISMRQAIIDGAIKSFSKLGLKKTTIVDIANGAGVTRGTVYFHFKDKAAIVEASADHLSAVLSRDA
jgi:AcrR family transcriptional regulator